LSSKLLNYDFELNLVEVHKPESTYWERSTRGRRYLRKGSVRD